MDLKYSIEIIVCAFVCIFFQTGCAFTKPAKSHVEIDVSEFNVKKDVLKNGLRVLYVEDHSSPVVSYSTWFKVGSAWEKKGATGIAHLFEHLMFKGTPKYPGKEFFHQLEKRGATINAYTQNDATVYYEVVAAPYLEQVIEMEADRLVNLKLTQKDLDSERQIVKEERRLRVESSFQVLQLEELLRRAFPTHPYGWPTIGYQADLDRLSLKECNDFFKKYYQPANALIVISGDFDYAKVRGWIEKYYGSIEGHAVPELVVSDEKIQKQERRFELVKPVAAESFLMGYYIPTMFSDDVPKISMLSWALFSMASSRANLHLVREKQLALEVGADAMFQRFPGLFYVAADLRSGVRAETAQLELDQLIEDVKRNGISAEELSRVKNALKYATVQQLKSSSGVANWFASAEFYWGDYRRAADLLNRYHLMTVGDLQKAAQQYLRKDNRVVVVLRGKKAKR